VSFCDARSLKMNPHPPSCLGHPLPTGEGYGLTWLPLQPSRQGRGPLSPVFLGQPALGALEESAVIACFLALALYRGERVARCRRFHPAGAGRMRGYLADSNYQMVLMSDERIRLSRLNTGML
jgi:hypothetical protein